MKRILGFLLIGIPSITFFVTLVFLNPSLMTGIEKALIVLGTIIFVTGSCMLAIKGFEMIEDYNKNKLYKSTKKR